jgi:hypothetical protein
MMQGGMIVVVQMKEACHHLLCVAQTAAIMYFTNQKRLVQQYECMVDDGSNYRQDRKLQLGQVRQAVFMW